MLLISLSKDMLAFLIKYKKEIVTFTGRCCCLKCLYRNTAQRSRNETFVFISIVSALVSFDAFWGDDGASIFPIVERSVHLKSHTFFESVLDNRGDKRHLLDVVTLFLDNGCDNQRFAQLRVREVTAKLFTGKRIHLFVGVVKEMMHH